LKNDYNNKEEITPTTKSTFILESFPLEKIKKLSAECEGDFDKLRKCGITTTQVKHEVNRDNHDAYMTTYTTTCDGHWCEYSYQYCPVCKEVFKKQKVLLDNAKNTAHAITC